MATQGGVMMSKWVLWVLGLIVSAHLVFVAHSVIQCTDALPKVVSCQDFVFGNGPDKPSDACCAGLRDLEKMVATSQPDREALCQCLKQGASILPIDFDKANQLPKLCNLTLNITIRRDMDCDKF